MRKSLKVIADEWLGCQRCGLGKERDGLRIVFGTGSARAKYLLLYDSPTESDVVLGAPMTGREGDILLEQLELAGISPKDVYCTPVVGCRPVVSVPETADKAAHLADRAPSKEELAACRVRVEEVIYAVDPLVILTLGDVSWRTLVKSKDRRQFTTLGAAVGELFTAVIRGRWLKEVVYDVMPLISMKQIMAQPSFAPHGPMATNVKHMHRARTYVEFLEKAGKRDLAAAGMG